MSRRTDTAARGIRCETVDQHANTVRPSLTHHDDAAIIIGLALGYARQATDAAFIPETVLTRLNTLADQGEPTCRMVRDWLKRKRPKSDRLPLAHRLRRTAQLPVCAEIISTTATTEVQ
ncbi:hypothetical protein PMI07_004349 [Rhizobium sp. CF080]|uniref:hypothetical protein n=1 Tax=Rhizobium sp. (strain CF080) TaxID=1144310 RepID=UPI0002715EAE|nr:hypothetical protein [Rhizobium sp. CF080]EUC01063.1 hypothetical protein PMI07_004349 [Rhizobium sp. CF080]